MIIDATDWAVSEFEGTPGLEKRLRDRLIDTAAGLADQPPGASLPQRFAWAELKAADNLIDRAAERPDDLQAVHRQRTRDRMAVARTVLVVHDTTTLDFSSHAAVADQLGPIGDGGGRGFLQHNSLAIDPDTHELLGLIHQQTFLREPTPAGETRGRRARRPRRESDVWLDGVTAVGRMPDDAHGVHVGDRGADFFGRMATCRSTAGHFLIRLVQNRAVGVPLESLDETPDDETQRDLMDEARRVPVTTTKELEIGSRGGRPSRVARLALGSVRVTVRPPKGEPRWRAEAPLTVTVVRVWEPHPPAGVDPLEWILGTDLADQSADALVRYCGWSEWRWPTAEEYHKVQKTGLGIEKVRFETKDRLLAAITLLSVVAVRVLGLRWYREGRPDDPVETVASDVEVAVVAALEPTRASPATVRQFVDAVARLGGWLGRTGDGPPGWASIWRGYQRLADLVRGFELAEAIKPRRKPKPKRCG